MHFWSTKLFVNLGWIQFEYVLCETNLENKFWKCQNEPVWRFGFKSGFFKCCFETIFKIFIHPNETFLVFCFTKKWKTFSFGFKQNTFLGGGSATEPKKSVICWVYCYLLQKTSYSAQFGSGENQMPFFACAGMLGQGSETPSSVFVYSILFTCWTPSHALPDALALPLWPYGAGANSNEQCKWLIHISETTSSVPKLSSWCRPTLSAALCKRWASIQPTPESTLQLWKPVQLSDCGILI